MIQVEYKMRLQEKKSSKKIFKYMDEQLGSCPSK